MNEDTNPSGIDNGTNPGGVGRPSKFGDEKACTAIEAAKEGKSKAGCARAVGVDKSTLHYWLEQSYTFRDSTGQERRFSNAYMRARAEGESKLIQGGLKDDGIDTSMAKFLLATSFSYKNTESREIRADIDRRTRYNLSDENKHTALELIKEMQKRQSVD